MHAIVCRPSLYLNSRFYSMKKLPLIPSDCSVAMASGQVLLLQQREALGGSQGEVPGDPERLFRSQSSFSQHPPSLALCLCSILATPTAPVTMINQQLMNLKPLNRPIYGLLVNLFHGVLMLPSHCSCAVLSDANKRFLYDVGVYNAEDDEDSVSILMLLVFLNFGYNSGVMIFFYWQLKGMGDFIGEMAQMMSQAPPTVRAVNTKELLPNLHILHGF
jgi:hypothetical protein